MDAADEDQDGLSNGYECWFTYNGLLTCMSEPDTDNDGLQDGWEVQYGLNPTDDTGDHGANGNPDGDAYNNKTESDNYVSLPGYVDASYDPLKTDSPYGMNRQVVSLSEGSSIDPCSRSFTITRWADYAGNLSQPLTVYYSVGGNLTYGIDYTLSPEPLASEYPRVFAIEMPGVSGMVFQQDATITVNLTGTPLSGDAPTLTVALTPYGVAAVPQVPVDCGAEPCLDAEDWKYVVDLKGRQDRVSLNFVRPFLSASCRLNRLVLNWEIPPELAWTIQGFLIKRSTSGGPYEDIATVGGDRRDYVDTDVNTDVTYCYTVVAHVQGPITYEACDLPSNEECLSTCPPPPLGPMDIVFIIDNTGSQSQNQALDTVKSAVIQSLDDIAATGVTYRLALLTPDNDQVNVRTNFSANNRTAFEDAVNLLPDLGDPLGNNIPESTDECIYTAVHARAAIDAVKNPAGCTRNNPITPLQIGDFSPAFSSTRKFIVLITDAPPGGFCDPFDFDASLDGARAHTYAQDAHTNCIKINAIQVSGRGTANDIEAMLDYRDTTCGWYSHPAVDVDEIREAIATMLYTPGACSCP